MANNISTTIIPGVMGGTNIIRNVYNMGGSGCDAGTQYCSEGYGLYFPCLKSITKGQDVCFDFYITDNSTQDVVDLRDVDAITLNLTGAFGCQYGSFSYPDNIQSLQSEEFELVYANLFGDDNICKLNVIPLDMEGNDILDKKTGKFYAGTEVTVGAEDTYDYIFVGWVFGDDDELCEDDIKNGLKDSKFTFEIYGDTTIYAIYRMREIFIVQNHPENKNGIFCVSLGEFDDWYPLSNKNTEIFDDSHDSIEVLEGHTFAVWCRPNVVTIDKEDSVDDDYMYEFWKWDDGVGENLRYFIAGECPSNDKNEIYLKAECRLKDKVEYDSDIDFPYIDYSEFKTFGDGVYIETGEFGEDSDEDVEYPYIDYSIIFPSVGYVSQGFEGCDGYISFENCPIIIPSNVEGAIRVDISAKGNCGLIVKVNGQSSEIELSNDYMVYPFYFDKCDGSDIEIFAKGKVFIDNVDIFKENIVDKGKASLCLGPEITSNLPSGKLSVSGAIAVDGVAYGLPMTQIGEVNKLNKINII